MAIEQIHEGGNYTAISTTTALSLDKLIGITVSSSTAGTITITDGAAVTVLAVTSVVAGQYLALPCRVRSGLITVTVGGALAATVWWS